MSLPKHSCTVGLPAFFRNRRSVRVAAVTICITYILFTIWPRQQLQESAKLFAHDLCQNNQLANDIVVGVHTGASEASERIPVLMETSLRCAKNVFIFSDLEQDIGRYHLYDALVDISPEVRKLDPIFEFYRLQQEAWERDGNVNSTKGMKNVDDPDTSAAWTLDKYKFAHILEKLWEHAPEKEWYVLIDADTYVVWPNLLSWLPSLDSAKKMFLGSVAFLGPNPFAHGGSGTVFSKALMYDYAVVHNGTAARLDPEVHKSCCGDAVIGDVLKEYGNSLINMQPEITGHTPSSIPWRANYWCQPVLTMHHLKERDMRAFYEFETGRGNKTTHITWAEVFGALVKEQVQSMPDMQEDWDNYSNVADLWSGIPSDGANKNSTQEFEECAKICEADANCFQYSWDGQDCFRGQSIRLGERTKPGGKKWRSGWHQPRIEEWISKQPPCNDANVADGSKRVHY
ncbi:hypothetical protein WAI453_012455 [Rhynchosporium graminicola]